MQPVWGWAEAVPGEAERIDIRFVDTAVVFSMIGYFSPMRQMGEAALEGVQAVGSGCDAGAAAEQFDRTACDRSRDRTENTVWNL